MSVAIKIWQSSATDSCRCPQCGNNDHCTIMTNEYGVHQCRVCSKVWEDHKEGKVLAIGLTSGQQYREMLRDIFGYKSERQVFRLMNELGSVEVEGINSHSSRLTFYPAGGIQRIPLAVGTEEVDGQRVKEIHRKGQYPHLLAGIDPNISGQPYSILCRFKD